MVASYGNTVVASFILVSSMMIYLCVGGYRRNVEVTCVAVMRSLLSDGAGVPGSQVSGNVN